MIPKIGQKISYLLRHDPQDLKMDKYGWVTVNSLLDKLNISKEELDIIVNTDNKQRYSYSEDGLKIRANQGHSIPIELNLKEKVPPVVLYHGTSSENYKKIMDSGFIRKMSRNHVHLSEEVSTAYNVGKRHSKYREPIIFMIDCKRLYQDGFKFFLSENGVWLTDDISIKYLTLLQK